MLGEVTHTTTWSNWALEPGALSYPHLRSVTANGERFRELAVVGWTELPVAPADSFALPDSVVQRFRAEPPAPVTAAPLRPRLLGPDVVLYLGGYQSAAARQDDGVLIIEAPESNARSRAVLAEVEQRWPGTRIKGVVVSSPMWMHLGGNPRITLPGASGSTPPEGVAPVIGRILAARHSDPADGSAKHQRPARLTVVRGSIRIGRAGQAVDLTPAIGPHGQSMLLVHWPGRRVLYASDVLVPDLFEPAFAAAATGPNSSGRFATSGSNVDTRYSHSMLGRWR